VVYGTNTQINNTMCFNNGDDRGELIDRGDCQSTTPPMLFGETVPVNVNGTQEQSTEITGYDGRAYVWKYIITTTGTLAQIRLNDNITAGDMHGLIAGLTYIFKVWVYIPSVGGPLASETRLVLFGDVSGTTSVYATTQDAWELITLTKTMGTDARCNVQVSIDATAGSGEFCYVGDVSLTCPEQGIRNIYEHNYLDEGTGTSL
jgi:hypothetical protein